jgi:hypothetical protein
VLLVVFDLEPVIIFGLGDLVFVNFADLVFVGVADLFFFKHPLFGTLLARALRPHVAGGVSLAN